MKTYNNLWGTVISDDNIMAGIYNATHSNMKRHAFDKMKKHPEKYVVKVRSWVENFMITTHTPKIINDGISAKKREIIVPTMKEHVVQHCLMNVLKPIFIKGMYQHSYASIPGRGCHKGKKYLSKWLRKDPKNTKYCLKFDIRKFFQSVDREILMHKIYNVILDDKVRGLIYKIISINKKGIPLGFYTSQWFANFCLQDFDHYVKEQLHVKCYMRYMDDIVILGPNKRKLHKIKDLICDYLYDELKLSLKDDWQIFKIDNGDGKGRFIDFMGFKFYGNRTTIRKGIARKCMRKARRIHNKERATVHDARQMLTYIGWSKATDTFQWLKRHILSKVSFKHLRKVVSRYDKWRNTLCYGKNSIVTQNQNLSTTQVPINTFMLLATLLKQKMKTELAMNTKSVKFLKSYTLS